MVVAASRPIAAHARSQRDPTRTTLLRNSYARDLRGRFTDLARLVRQTIEVNDALRLGAVPAVMTTAPATRYDFPVDAGKVEAFMDWLRRAADDGVLQIYQRSGQRITSRGEFQNIYVRRAYSAGLSQAEAAMQRLGTALPAGIETLLNQPIHIDALQMMYTRNFEELRGITDQMSQQIARTLTDGMVRGVGPREMARRIAADIQKIGINRATILARTEVIRAHAEASLNRYEQVGIQVLMPHVEFANAGDKKVCEKCKGLETVDNGLGRGVFTIAQARGVIPVHPLCRCAWLPFLGGV